MKLLFYTLLSALAASGSVLRRAPPSVPAAARAALVDLGAAVAGGDLAAVDRLTAELRRVAVARQGKVASDSGRALPAEHTAGPQPLAAERKAWPQAAQQAVPEAVPEAVPQAASQAHSRAQAAQLHGDAAHHQGEVGEVPGQCVLDDMIFQLLPDAKLEIYSQMLNDPVLSEALSFTKVSGWYTCAVYGEECACDGDVRMVDWDRSVETPLRVDTRVTGSVTCTLEAFGMHDVKPGATKLCECARFPKAGFDDFHLRKRLTSTSYLQEVWIFLLRFLGRAQLLPLGTHDRLYHGVENWAQRQTPGKMPLVVERVWIEMFVKQFVVTHGTGPRCLEWGDPQRPGQGFNYAYMVPQCTEPVDMQFDPVFYGHKSMGVEGNIVYSDIDHLPQILTSPYDRRVNLIFATQVFEHLADPVVGIKALFDSILPGGAIVFTAPQQAQFHMVPHDYFRYTKEGALHLLQGAGFCVPGWGFAGGGDFVFDIGRAAGLQVQDFPNEEIAGAFQYGYDSVSHGAITIHAIGFVPPHAACAQNLPPV